jgi:hypothetical protein
LSISNCAACPAGRLGQVNALKNPGGFYLGTGNAQAAIPRRDEALAARAA